LHIYSGLAPDHFREFVRDIKTCERSVYSDPSLAATALYQALEHVRELSLYTQRADQVELGREINSIADRVALTGEEIIQRISIQRGIRFFPKFLHNVIPDPEHDPTRPFKPTYKSTDSVCTTGSCRG
jgi:hypothetical protein